MCFQNKECARNRAGVEAPSSSASADCPSPVLLSYADPNLRRCCNQSGFGQGPSDETDIASQARFRPASMFRHHDSMPRSWESQAMSLFDIHGDSLDLNDQSAAMPTNWPDAGLPGYPDNNHVPLEGVGREVNPANFDYVPQLNSSGSTGYMVSLCAVRASILYRHTFQACPTPCMQTAVHSSTGLNEQVNPLFCDDNFLSQVNPSLWLQSQAPSASDGGGMTPSSSSWHRLTPPSRSSTDINSDGYQEVSLLAAASGVDFRFCSPEDPFGDLLGLKSDRPTRNCSNEPPHLKGRKRSIAHREVKIAAMHASSTKQTLSVKPTKGKRKSPLSKEGRRNAHAVRKNGGQCIRCRLYKAKVFLILFLLHCLPLTKASATQAILVKNALINLKPQSYFASHAIVTN